MSANDSKLVVSDTKKTSQTSKLSKNPSTQNATKTSKHSGKSTINEQGNVKPDIKQILEQVLKTTDENAKDAGRKLEDVFVRYYKTKTLPISQENALKMEAFLNESLETADMIIDELIQFNDRKEEQTLKYMRLNLNYFQHVLENKMLHRMKICELYLDHLNDSFESAFDLIDDCESYKEELESYISEVNFAKIGNYKPVYYTMWIWYQQIMDAIEEKHYDYCDRIELQQLHKIAMSQAGRRKLSIFLSVIRHHANRLKELIDERLEIEEGELGYEISNKEYNEYLINRLKSSMLNDKRRVQFHAKQKKDLLKEFLTERKNDVLQEANVIEQVRIKRLIRAKDRVLNKIWDVVPLVDEIKKFYRECLKYNNENRISTIVRGNLGELGYQHHDRRTSCT